MHSTFLRHLVTPAEPRNRLLPGVTAWRLPARHRARSAPPAAEPNLEIPASAKDFALDTLKFEADPKQQEVLAAPDRRVIICCSRQWGKSTIAALKILHHALTTAGSLTLVASKSLRQAAELLEKVIAFARTLDLPIHRVPHHPESLLLPNGARVIALPGQPASLRGFSAVSLLVIDEAAYVPDQLYNSLRPTLATTNGAIWLLSTPQGRRGFFYDSWESNAWTKFEATALDCPRISPEFLEEERRLHGAAFYKREYLCDFGYAGESYFDIDGLDAACDAGRHEAAQQFAFGRPVTRFYFGFDVGQRASHSAVVALEIVRGATSQRDPVTFAWIHQTQIRIRKIERFPLNIPYETMIHRLNRIVRDLTDPRHATVLVDATGCGQPFVDILKKHHLGVLVSPIGITSTGTGSYNNGIARVSKKALLSAANYVMTSQSLVAEPGMDGLADLREEMESFRLHTTKYGSDGFRGGQKDDLVMAFALAAWKAREFLPASTP